MKTKTDFVTNSSSTSYMLSSVACGWLPLLPNYTETLPKLFKGAEFGSKEDHRLQDCYANFTYEIPELEEDGWNEEEYLKYSVSVVLDDMERCDIDSKQTMVEIKVSTPNEEPVVDAPLIYTIGVLTKLLSITGEVPFASFSFFVSPSEYWGDGWGGDPMGKYGEVPDLYISETKTGRILIVDSTISPKVFCLGKEQVIIDTLEKMIGTNSLHIGGTQNE